MRPGHVGRLGGTRSFVLEPKAARGRAERRQLGRTESDQRHAQRLQHLERAGQVQDGFCAGAHHGDRGSPQRYQICGHVQRALAAAVDPADASRGEYLDADSLGEDGGRRHRGRRVEPGDDQCAQIAGARFCDTWLGTENFDLAPRQPDDGSAGDDADRGRTDSFLAHNPLEASRDLEIPRLGQTMSDDRGLQRDDGGARLERPMDIGRELDGRRSRHAGSGRHPVRPRRDLLTPRTRSVRETGSRRRSRTALPPRSRIGARRTA